jgi:hypothetical protein
VVAEGRIKKFVGLEKADMTSCIQISPVNRDFLACERFNKGKIVIENHMEGGGDVACS